MKTYRGVKVWFNTFLTLALDALPREKSPRYPLDRRLDAPQSYSGRCEDEEISFPVPGIEPRFLDLPSQNLSYYTD
jgi:hypothetical protein